MSYRNVLLAFMSVLALFSSTGRAQDQVVVESARETPLADDVDGVVYDATPGGIPVSKMANDQCRSGITNMFKKTTVLTNSAAAHEALKHLTQRVHSQQHGTDRK